MRLREKESGGIVETLDDSFLANFSSLKELNDKYEDAPEETKPFVEAAWPKYVLKYAVGEHSNKLSTTVACDGEKELHIADQDYYEILPDGTKKTKFTWYEAMEIEKKTNGKWRIPTEAEWYAIVGAFGKEENGEVTGKALAKNLNLTTDKDGYGVFWSSTAYSTSYARRLLFNASNIYPQDNGNKMDGFSVRCVAGKGE